MIELIATVESIEQAQNLINVGVDTLYIGNDQFGLRLPNSFSRKELTEITYLAHEHGKHVRVAVNAIMHNDRIDEVKPYLDFLEEIGVDSITVGDTGVIHLLRTTNINLPYIFDAQTIVTSARQINFWANRGAKGAVLARELPYAELRVLQAQLSIPAEILIYGATCIHHSKRPLLENYTNFTDSTSISNQQNNLYISEAKKPNTHYSLYEDINGTHVFATDDLNLLPQLDKLTDIGLTKWKLDGLFTKGEHFENIARIFVEAKQAIEKNTWDLDLMEQLNNQLITLHPSERSISEGFFLKDPSEVQ